MMNHREGRSFLFLAVLAIAMAISPVLAHAGQPSLMVTKERRINMNVDNKPLDVILRMMAERRLFQLNGGNVPGGEPLTLHFSNLTLPQALAKMMRGYNYVLIGQGKDGLPVLAVVGKIERARANPSGTVGSPVTASQSEASSNVPPEAAAPQPAGQVRPPGGPRPRPPRQAEPQGTGEKQDVQKQEGQQQQAGTQPAQPAAAPPAESTGVSTKDLLTGQPQGTGEKQDVQKQEGQQQQTGTQPAQPAETPPAAESPGVHF
ncbi:MAG: hypothetical protein ABSC19_15405 [Syntrophorhabdales bacterium]